MRALIRRFWYRALDRLTIPISVILFPPVPRCSGVSEELTTRNRTLGLLDLTSLLLLAGREEPTPVEVV